MDNARRKVERSPLIGDRSRVLIGADTIIACGSLLFGKPVGQESAQRMLLALSGREHEVITGVCISGPAMADGPPSMICDAALTRVTFNALSIKDIREYIDSGEWQGKAGAYAIQGQARTFVSALDGDFDNVVGLPIPLINDLLRQNFIHCRFC